MIKKFQFVILCISFCFLIFLFEKLWMVGFFYVIFSSMEILPGSSSLSDFFLEKARLGFVFFFIWILLIILIILLRLFLFFINILEKRKNSYFIIFPLDKIHMNIIEINQTFLINFLIFNEILFSFKQFIEFVFENEHGLKI